MNDGFNALESVVVNINIFDGLSYTRDHRCKLFEVTHLLDLSYLAKEIIEVELILGNFLLQTFCFFFIVLFLCTFYQ